jgi:1,4-alpha-glucan branching enzyme
MSAHKEHGLVGAMPAQADIAALLHAEHHDPFSILGPHTDGADGQFIRSYLPGALSVQVLARDSGEHLGSLEQQQTPGLFVGHFSTQQPYVLKINWAGGEQLSEDPYSFGELLGEMDLYLFAEGNHRDLARTLGAQAMSIDGVEGVRFAVWAPNARRVSVVGDFNVWDGRRHPMRLRHPTGVWEIFIPRLQPGEAYKYEVLAHSGILPLKADPMALQTQLPPQTGSRVAKPMAFAWDDQAWLDGRAERQATEAPLSIYELHAGSWMCEMDEFGEVVRSYNWHELAERLIPYVQQLGFTHIELMPIMEHPFGGSWGYQLLSQFAPSARCGSY